MLKIHEIVALLENGHGVDALLALFFFGVELFLFLFYRLHVDLTKVEFRIEVLVERVWRVDGVELFGSIFASVLEYDLGAAWVLWQELGDIVCASVDNNPARVLGVVLGYLLAGELVLLGVVAVVVHGCGVVCKEGGKEQ